MTMRSSWKGSLSCGVLNTPVKMYGATEEKGIKFNQIHNKCGTKIQQFKHCPACNAVVDTTEINKGYDIGGGDYVILEPQELESIRLQSVKSIEVLEFISPENIDPRLPNKSYFLTPDKGGVKPFFILMSGMKEAGVWAVGRVVMHDKEHIVLIRPFEGNVLLLQTLFWSDELRDQHEISPDVYSVSEQESALSKVLVDTMRGDGDLLKYHDQYRKAVEELISAKSAGETISMPEEPAEAIPASDMVEQLLASIELAKQKVGS